MFTKPTQLLTIAAFMCVGLAHAQSVNPWITSDAKVSANQPMPNIYSIEDFHNSPAFKDLKPKEFCRKLFDLYYDGRRKSWKSFKQGMELWSHTGQEPRACKNVIELDPILLLNVHGTGYCGIQSGLLEGIYQSRPGWTPGKPVIEARRWFLGGIIHSVCDAYYDGHWHYYDIDLGGFAGDSKKDVWSVADVLQDPKGYYGAKTNIKSKYFYKADKNGAWVDKINKKKSYAFQDNHMLGHEMTLSLRKGERFSRYFNQQAAGWTAILPHTKKINAVPKGYCELVWMPTPQDAEAAALAVADGHQVFAIRCPYSISSSKVEAKGKAEVSHDLGKTWIPLSDDGNVAGAVNHWDYLLKVPVGSLKKVTTRGLVHPGALPRVDKTPTKMTVQKSADYQMLTYLPDWSSAEKFKSNSKAEGLKYKPSQRLTFTGGQLSGRGSLTVPVQAPPGCQIVKLSACVMGGASTKATANNYLELHLGPAGNTSLNNRSTDCSPWGNKPGSRVEHWQQNVNGTAMIDPCEQAEVKVVVNGYGTIQGIRIYVGYKSKKPNTQTGSLIITHGIDGKKHEQKIPTANLDKAPVTYTVPGGQKNEYITMEVK